MSEELILSPSDPGWHERRREVFTASDMGVLFGLPGFGGKTLSDVAFVKKYGLTTDNSTPSTRLGQRMEPIILDEAEMTLGRIIDRQAWLINGQIGATLDGRCESNGFPVEAKTSGLLWKPDAEWGDGGDEVPSAILLQVQAQLFVTGADQGIVAAVIGGRGFMLYEIPRAGQLIEMMQTRVADFMSTLSTDVAYPEPPQLETLKRIRRQPHKIVPLSGELVDRYRSVTESAKAAADAKETVQRELLAALGDAEAGDSGDGLWTYGEQSRKGYTVERTTFRTLRFKRN